MSYARALRRRTLKLPSYMQAGSVQAVQAAVDEVAATIDPTAALLGFYDQSSLELASGTLASGTAAKWNDAQVNPRFSIGPLTAQGATKPSVNFTGARGEGGTGVTTDGSQNGFTSAASPLLSLDQRVWIATIQSVGTSADGFSVIIEDTTGTQYMGIKKISINICNTYKLASGSNANNATPLVAPSATQRMIFCESGSAGTTIEVAGSHRFFENSAYGNTGRLTGSAPFIYGPNLAGSSSSTNRLCIGMQPSAGAYRADSFRAIMVGRGDKLRVIAAAMKAYADNYHAVVYPSKPRAFFPGDSITYGANLTTPSTMNYAALLMNESMMSGYDQMSLGSGGANYTNLGISGWYLQYFNEFFRYTLEPTLGLWPGVKDTVFLWLGTNDGATALATTGAAALLGPELIAQTQRAAMNIRRCQGAGTTQGVGIPPLPRGDVSSGALAALKALSDWYKASGASYFDKVVPLYDNPKLNNFTFGSDSATVNADGYFQGDHVHPTQTGDAAIEGDVTYGVKTAVAGII